MPTGDGALRAFELDPLYKQIAERLADLKAAHPDGCVRPVDPARPYWIEQMDGQTFIVYAAACYRGPDDVLPGIGVAWEPYPGKTSYTKLSELQNAETSAWGRAIVASLASESKAVASAEDVRNRQADHDAPEPVVSEIVLARKSIAARISGLGVAGTENVRAWALSMEFPSKVGQWSHTQIEACDDYLDIQASPNWSEALARKAEQNAAPTDHADRLARVQAELAEMSAIHRGASEQVEGEQAPTFPQKDASDP